MDSTAVHANGDSASQAIGKQDFQQFLDRMATRAIEGCDFQPGEFEDADEGGERSQNGQCGSREDNTRKSHLGNLVAMPSIVLLNAFSSKVESDLAFVVASVGIAQSWVAPHGIIMICTHLVTQAQLFS